MGKKEKVIEIDLLWDNYFEEKTIENRNKLVESYIKHVEYLVNKNVYKMPDGMAKEDLLQSGMCGLIEAVERFSKINGNKFETYANIRIQGAIFDYIRYYKKSNLGISRVKSTKIREIIEKKNELEQLNGRTPTKKEIAEALDMKVEAYEKILQEKEVKVFYEEEMIERNQTAERNIETPEENFMNNEEKRMLEEKIKELNEIQRRVLKLYYYEERNFKQIGEELELTESRISQIHKKAVFRLKYLFEENLNGEVQ